MPLAPVLVLDGGVGHLLKTRAGDPAFLGGALLALRDPPAVAAVHTAFIDAGADVVTAASFGVTPRSLDGAGLAAPGDLDALVSACVRAARAASDAAPRPVTVAAPLPPLGQCYEAHATTRGAAAGAARVYKRIAAAALAAGADCLLAETAASAAAAAAALSGAVAAGAPPSRLWASWTVRDDDGATTRGGDALTAAAAAAVTAAGGPPAVLAVNCAAPAAVEAGVRALTRSRVAASGVAVGGYANAFQTTTGGWLADGGWGQASSESAAAAPSVLPPAEFADAARRWLAAGARVVGGCCGAGPDHTAAVAGVVAEWRREELGG